MFEFLFDLVLTPILLILVGGQVLGALAVWLIPFISIGYIFYKITERLVD